MCGNAEKFSGYREGEQQPWIVLGRVRIECPVGQLGLDKLLDFGLPPDSRIRAREGCEPFAVTEVSWADTPSRIGHLAIVTGTRTRSG